MIRAVLIVALVSGLTSVLSAAPNREAKARQELAVLEQKLHGSWDGTGPCDGGIAFRADGTYDRTSQGPAGTNSSGTWKIRWDALPPALVLTCRESDDPDAVGKVTEFKLVQLDNEGLELARPDGRASSKSAQFARAKK